MDEIRLLNLQRRLARLGIAFRYQSDPAQGDIVSLTG